MKQLSQIVDSAGKSIATTDETPSQSSERASRPLSEHQIAAGKAVNRLFGQLPPIAVPDPRGFLARATECFAAYPEEAWAPASRLVLKTRITPLICHLEEALAAAYESIERRIERARARALPPPASVPRTPEQQAAIDAQVETARRELNAPEGIALQRRRGHDGKHGHRIADDLLAKRQRLERLGAAPCLCGSPI